MFSSKADRIMEQANLVVKVEAGDLMGPGDLMTVSLDKIHIGGIFHMIIMFPLTH